MEIVCTYSYTLNSSEFVSDKHIVKFDVCLSVHRCICVEKKYQLDVTEGFIALMIRSTCFGHFYAHRQELETICELLPPMVCSACLLVVGGQVHEAGCESRKRDAAATSNQALHTIGGNNTHIVSSS